MRGLTRVAIPYNGFIVSSADHLGPKGQKAHRMQLGLMSESGNLRLALNLPHGDRAIVDQCCYTLAVGRDRGDLFVRAQHGCAAYGK